MRNEHQTGRVGYENVQTFCLLSEAVLYMRWKIQLNPFHMSTVTVATL